MMSGETGYLLAAMDFANIGRRRTSNHSEHTRQTLNGDSTDFESGKATRISISMFTSVKAVLRRLHSPDIPDLERYVPTGPSQFLLQIFVGPSDGPGEESFDVLVCTPTSLAAELNTSPIINGRHRIIMAAYDYKLLENYVRGVVEGAEGITWREVAEKIGRLGRWEFEDYRPRQ
jgi:immunity protein 8 of polymorphic toxin system